MMGKPEWGMNVLKGERKRVITALPYLMILCKSNKSVVFLLVLFSSRLAKSIHARKLITTADFSAAFGPLWRN
jgi:hypothetical protein